MINKEKAKIKLIIAGSRDFHDYSLLKKEVTIFTKEYNNKDIIIVSGKATGADELGEIYAFRHSIDLKTFPANWKKYGKSAGFIRNNSMAIFATHCICFWDGKSNGTKDMIERCKKHNLKYKVIRYE